MPIKVGDKLPSVDVHEGDPHCIVNIAELFKGKKGILFGVPGAFTPACHKDHLPSYVESYEELKKKGIDIIACIAVNDAFVMKAWGNEQKADGKVRMLADPTGAFTRVSNKWPPTPLSPREHGAAGSAAGSRPQRPEFNPDLRCCLSVWSLHVLPVTAWVSLPHPNNAWDRWVNCPPRPRCVGEG
ncbi:peroxiredoxin-5, mitochondrial [Pristis pectinata]|uniref:peroxiredoxin-5, mitochondrial n=1 Tax=Pristis pectinata TaxID=685728 RepID=UPI00223E566F|nr:peroxiredoxin-5, mitochondrial [Pristis pectinata]